MTALLDGRVGGRPLAIFTVSHMVAGIADAFVTVSLAGSLFFSVSTDASRNQVLLYLVVTMAPFAVLAPLVGPVVDRLRGTRRLLVVGCYVLRGVCAISLAFALYDVSFYVLALAMLITSKASGVVRIEAGTRVRGDVAGESFSLEEGAEFVGRLDASFELPAELSGGSGGGRRR